MQSKVRPRRSSGLCFSPYILGLPLVSAQSRRDLCTRTTCSTAALPEDALKSALCVRPWDLPPACPVTPISHPRAARHRCVAQPAAKSTLGLRAATQPGC